MSEDLVLYPEYSNVLFKASFLSLGSALYALAKGHCYIGIVPLGVFLTSINYWRKPDYSWRRYLDMTYVHFAFSYQLYLARNAEYGRYYYAISFLSAGFYQIGLIYYKRKDYWRSTYAHTGLHIVSNVANVILYSGKI